MTVKIVSGQLEFSNQDLAEKLRKKGARTSRVFR